MSSKSIENHHVLSRKPEWYCPADGSLPDPFPIRKQSCVQASTLFGIRFSHCYCHLPSIGRKMGYISTKEVMGTFLTSHVCEQRTK